MISMLKTILEFLFRPTIRETETHYLIELYSEDGYCSFWIEKDNTTIKA